ncbi:alpha carbonic anhydrase 7-like [Euphorbia lathyris]|uniref:alpha carbonic anhydrase 7-like n=1 Tax=Euphorbia lathyris TaxID=212925 RepID=UPI0033137844
MGKLGIQLFLLCFTFFISVSHQMGLDSKEEVEHEKEFDYQHPGDWGKIHPEWAACEHGKMQSPIDLSGQEVKGVSELGPLKHNYTPAPATLKNRGHDMMLQWDSSGAGTLEINGTEYVLKQAHWHSPSEHTIQGKQYALELHLVHQSKDGTHAVVAFLYQLGQPDAFIECLAKKLEEVAGAEKQVLAVGPVNPNDIHIDTGNFYRYTGSLTVPPCTENVIWTISKKIKDVTNEQVKLIRVAVHDRHETNARPTQELNGRDVHVNGP